MTSFEDARKRFERDYLTRILKMTKGSVTQAAMGMPSTVSVRPLSCSRMT